MKFNVVIVVLSVIASALCRNSRKKDSFIGQDDALPAPACNEGFTQYGSYCYLYASRCCTFSYDSVVRICRENYGADLASIHSTDEDQFIRSHYSSESMIGLRYYDAPVANLTWSDNTAVNFENLAVDFIKYAEYFGYCAMIGAEKWENAECLAENGQERRFICKKRPTLYTNYVCPDPEELYFNSGEIASPQYPEDFYGHGEECMYKMAAKNGKKLKMTVSYYWFSGCSDANTTSELAIYEGYTKTDSALLGKLNCKSTSNSTRTFTTTSLNKMMLVVKISDGQLGDWLTSFSTV